MAELLVMCTCGLDDPNRASLAFLIAKVAKENKDEVTIFLANDAVIFAKKGLVSRRAFRGWDWRGLVMYLKFARYLRYPCWFVSPVLMLEELSKKT